MSGTAPPAFRRAATRISLLMAAEALRRLPTVADDGRQRRSAPPTAASCAPTSSWFRCCAPGSSMLEPCCNWFPRRAWVTSDCSVTRRRRSLRATTPSCHRTSVQSHVLMVDPMLATGGSSAAAHRSGEGRGRPEHRPRLRDLGARRGGAAAGARIRTWSLHACRRSANSTRTSSSCPGWATSGIACIGTDVGADRELPRAASLRAQCPSLLFRSAAAELN